MIKLKIHSFISRCRGLMISPADRAPQESLLYWQQTIFVSLLLTVLILGPVAVASSAFMFHQEGKLLMAVIIILFYLLFMLLAFLRSARYSIRLLILGWSFYALGLNLIIVTGPYGASMLFFCLSFVYLALNAPKHISILNVIINCLILLLLSLLYATGKLDAFPIVEFKKIWVIVVINIIMVDIIITQMIGLVLRGMEKRFIKEQKTNRSLRMIQEENARQINLLKSLRQSGNCISDTRLAFRERLQLMQEDLTRELQIQTSGIARKNRADSQALYLSSRPNELQGETLEIPDVPGPYLLMDYNEVKGSSFRTPIMDRIREDEIYFGSPFYFSEGKGYLEMTMAEEPDYNELEYLQMNLFQLSGAITNEQLIRQLESSRDLLESSYDEILMAWARILELRDIETNGHSRRVVSIAMGVAELLNLAEEEKIHLRRGAFLHDIGKLGIPDSILHKPSALSPQEWSRMKDHPRLGREAVCNIPFLKPALPVIYSHHERWDGTGYPEGLKGEEIPLSARIFSLADVYDALVSDRPYRSAMQQDEIISYMLSEKERIFDPELLDLFVSHYKTVTSVDAEKVNSAE